MTHRSSLLAVLAIVLLVLGFTTRAPVPGRRIPIADDRAGTVLATHLSARHSAPMFPGTRPEAMRSGRSRIGPPASAEENTQVVALLEQTLAADPNDAESHYQLGQILVMLDRANDAIVHYERAITIDPSRGDYHFQLGKALHRHGQDERAVTAYQMSIDLDPVGGNCKFPICGNRKPPTLVVGGGCPAFRDVDDVNNEGAGHRCMDGRRGCC